MKFNVAIDKLEKGWNLSVGVDSIESAHDIQSEIAETHEGTDGTDAKPFSASLKRQADGSYLVTVYQSKLSQAQELIKRLYIERKRAN